MTDERILEIAKQFDGIYSLKAFRIAFARAIAADQREEDAKICLEMQQGWASDDHIECALQIRSMK